MEDILETGEATTEVDRAIVAVRVIGVMRAIAAIRDAVNIAVVDIPTGGVLMGDRTAAVITAAITVVATDS